MNISRGWERVAAGTSLRRYQARAVLELLTKLHCPGSRACLFAPPGSGKTRCALHVAAELRLPLEVRVPTTALVSLWQERIALNLIRVIECNGAPVRVLTYAAMGDFPENALVVLDEAHHMVATWGKQVDERLNASHRVLGLTATPPYESSGWDQFVSLVGTDPVTIDCPPLVRDRHLAPYQDLVWPVLTDQDDAPSLRQVHEQLMGLERDLGVEFDNWIRRSLEEDLTLMTEDRFAGRPSLLVGLCRLHHERGGELPLDLPPDKELTEPPTLQDKAAVLWAYGHDRPDVRTALTNAGFQASGKGIRLHDDVAYKSLAASRSRLRGCLDILAIEASERREELRALVLTDRDVEGDKLSAREVLKALVSDPRTDPLDPILVTGAAFWVDDDMWTRVAPKLPALPWMKVGGHHEVDVSQWSTAQRVCLATQLLHEGVSRCLVGTRHLLGEGWDCPAVNCLIDLTGITASVTINQARGRALRPDPQDPAKVASLWEVVSLLPGIPGGERMLEQLKDRHRHTLGIDDSGNIQTGISRISRLFLESVNEVARNVEKIQRQMATRVTSWLEVARKWRVGGSYVDRHVWRLGGLEPRIQNRRHNDLDIARLLRKPIPASRYAVRARYRRLGRIGNALMVMGGLAGSYSVFMLIDGQLAMFFTALLAAAAWGSIGISTIARNESRLHDATRRAVMDVLCQSLEHNHQYQGCLKCDGDEIWLEGTPEASRAFAESCAELLGPIRYPRYLLVEEKGDLWPVPSLLGEKKDSALFFGRLWADKVGACEVVYARQGRGREMLRQAWKIHQAGTGDLVEVREMWE